MTDGNNQGAFEHALDWHLRAGDLDADGWRAFANWIEADPANAVAMARIDAIDDGLGAVLIATSPPGSAMPVHRLPVEASARWPARRPIRWLAGGAAIAAGIVVVVVGVPRSQPVTEIATRAGEMRVVSFADGSRATLNGATLLRFSKTNPRQVELAMGEAVFSVRHDAARPFRVTAGDHVIEDVGTVFNVARTPGAIDVAVAEGSVMLDPQGAAVALGAGRALRVDTLAGSVTMRSVVAGNIGGWRTGVLSFDGAHLADVAAAIERRSGAKVGLDPGLPERPFTGSVRLSGNPDRDVPHLAALIGASARHDGTRWILSTTR